MSIEDIVKKEEVESYYQVGIILGRGKFATVKHITEKTTGTCYAAKYLRKRNHAVNCRNTILQEAELLQELVEHRSIVDVKEVFECSMVMIIVLELCTGGDLYHAIYADPFTEKESVYVLKQVIDALKYLHNKSILHLDIKPENILLINNQMLDIKLADFGLAVKLSPKEEFKRIIGTPEYVAPEVINFEPLTTASDMWSLGALTYALLCGYSPFLPEDDDSIDEEPSRFGEQADILSNVSQGKYDFDDDVFDNVSENAKEFIRNLLVPNPKRRLNADQCLRHQWLKTYDDTSLQQRAFTNSPDFQTSTSSGLSDFSDISTNPGSNMSADLYRSSQLSMHSAPGTPEAPIESRIPEEDETSADAIASTKVEPSYKMEASDEVAINKTKETSESKYSTETAPSMRSSRKLSDEKFYKSSSPKEDRTDSKYGSIYSSRYRGKELIKSSVSTPESSEEKKSTIRRKESEKTSPTASTIGEKDLKQQNENMGSSMDGKRRKNKVRSDTNLFVGIPGIPFKSGDYEHPATSEQRTTNNNNNKYTTILEESNQLDSTENNTKVVDKDSPNHARNSLQKRVSESKVNNPTLEAIPPLSSSKTRLSRYTKTTSNSLEIPNSTATSYRLDNLIRYFNYSDNSSTSSTTTTQLETPVYETPSPNRSPKSIRSFRSTIGEKNKLESVKSLDTLSKNCDISPITQRRLSSDLQTPLNLSGYKLNSALSTPAAPSSPSNSLYSSSKDASRSVDNLKDLVEQDSRSSSPVYSSLSISRRGSREYSTKTMPRMRSLGTTPQSCLCTAPHVRRIRLPYSKLDIEKVYLSNHAYKEHFEIELTTAYSPSNHNNNSNRPSLSPQLSIPCSPTINSIRYTRPSLVSKGMDMSMDGIYEHSPTSSKTPYSSFTAQHRRRNASYKDDTDDLDVESRLTQSTSLQSLKDLPSPHSPTLPLTRYTPNTGYRSRRSVEQTYSYQPYISKYRLNRTNCVTPENLY